MFAKSFTALVTPFRDGAFDKSAYEKIVSWQIEQGTHGLVPCGTTGETPVLELDEYAAVVKTCVETVAGRVPVMAGAGSNVTKKAVELAVTAEELGADALLAVSPYYNRPTQEGIIAHMAAIHDATNLPIVLYNVPARTGGVIETETVVHLAKNYPRIAGIKDASPDLVRPLEMRRALGASFALLSGEDATVGAYLGQGGDGCISVTANAAPALCAALHNAWEGGDLENFRRISADLLPLHRAMFCESNPAPAKYALSRLGFCRNELRLPLLPVTEQAARQIDAAMDGLNLSAARAA
ncbi:MAG: 4-hydroxy-tetrahydrodipicolinate synthase [Micavibrio sp.]|nr:MAG: 4-hydroxy-tetrahydrodipicolinate synthase [Micavibrio sp.]